MRSLHLLLLLSLVGLASAQDFSPSMPTPDGMALEDTGVVEERLARAIRGAWAALDAGPESAAAWGRLGHLYLAHERTGDAAACYRRATELAPEDYRWFYYLGRSTLDSDAEEAAAAFARAIELNPSYAPARLFQAQVLRRLGRFEHARRELERLEALEPGNAYSELMLGQIALAERRFQSARRHLERALGRNPEQSEAQAALANAYMALGNREAAARHAAAARRPTKHAAIADPLWERIVAAGMTSKWSIYRGRLALRRGDYRRAHEELEQVAHVEQRNPRVWLDLGAALLGLGRYEESVSAGHRALMLAAEGASNAMDPGARAMVHNNLGLAYEKLGRVAEAESELRRALGMDLSEGTFERRLARRNLVALYIRMGAARYGAGDLAGAAGYYRKALALEPETALAMNNLAVIYRAQGRGREALQLLQRSLALEPHASTERMLDALQSELENP